MVEFKWIQIFLILLVTLQFAVVNGQSRPSITVRAGDEVSLPCKNVIEGQDKCNSNAWFVTAYTRASTKTLVDRGQISKEDISESTYNRLSITENCSLVIKNVTHQDVGRYICRQFKKSGGQQSEDDVYLSVVDSEKHQVGDGVRLFCTVFTYDSKCDHTVKWLNDDNLDVVETEPYACSARVTFKTSQVNLKSNLPKCEVTDHQSGEKLLYDFSSGESKGGTTTENNTSSAKEVTPPGCAGCFVVNYVMLGLCAAELVLITATLVTVWWRLIIVSAGLSALIISVVTVNIWMRTKGNKTQTDGNTERNDEDEGAVVYENTGEPSVSIRLH